VAKIPKLLGPKGERPRRWEELDRAIELAPIRAKPSKRGNGQAKVKCSNESPKSVGKGAKIQAKSRSPPKPQVGGQDAPMQPKSQSKVIYIFPSSQ